MKLYRWRAISKKISKKVGNGFPPEACMLKAAELEAKPDFTDSIEPLGGSSFGDYTVFDEDLVVVGSSSDLASYTSECD